MLKYNPFMKLVMKKKLFPIHASLFERARRQLIINTSMSTASVQCISRVFAYINKERPDSYSNYDSFLIDWSSPESYQLVRRIGRGKYSDVFVGVDMRTDRDIVVKVLKPVRKRKISREIKILENLKGHPNIVSLLDVTKSERGIPSLIFEHVDFLEYSAFSHIITLEDVQFYMRELVNALLYSHSNGIIHRDVKPQNVIVNFSKRILKLIDWGLAEFYFPGTGYHVRVASRYYKPPELLIEYQFYDYSLDLWSYGCVLAGMIFQKEPIFQGADNRDQLLKILHILGSKDLLEYLLRLRFEPPKDFEGKLEGHKAIPLEDYITEENEHLCHSSVIDLLKKCLVVDHTKRISAEEALAHEFFTLDFSSPHSLVNQIN